MTVKKFTPEEIERFKQDKLSGKFQDKGLPLRNPNQNLISGNGTTTTTNNNNSKTKK